MTVGEPKPSQVLLENTMALLKENEVKVYSETEKMKMGVSHNQGYIGHSSVFLLNGWCEARENGKIACCNIWIYETLIFGELGAILSIQLNAHIAYFFE